MICPHCKNRSFPDKYIKVGPLESTICRKCGFTLKREIKVPRGKTLDEIKELKGLD